MTKKKKKSNLKELKKKVETEQKQTLPLLLIIILAGFILRLIYLIETENSPFITNLYSDSKIYFDWAKNISTSGNWLGDKIFFMSPGYPYFLAVIFSFFDDSIALIRIIQVIISSLNILVIFYIARYMFTRNTALLAATISAIYSIFIFYSGAILSETLQTFFVSILLLLLVKPGDDNYKKWFLIGILLGVSALFRANILLFGIFLFPYIFLSKKICATIKSRMKLVLILYAGILLVILPVTLRNYVVGNDLVLLTSNGGINFYLGNNTNATGIYNTPEGFDFFRDLAGENFAKKITGKDLSPSETSAYWFGKGIEFITKEPFDAFKLTVQKFFLFFDSDENPPSFIMSPDFFRTNYSTLLKLPLPSFYIILILSLMGIVFAWREKKNYSVIYLFTISYIISVVI
ncbi:MAG: glycosyltransferase family 39 protein, partial [Clostridiaceae bacterium]|nr:glycosyltransferase family 39 protein [Clostridiaceae bacterium]